MTQELVPKMVAVVCRPDQMDTVLRGAAKSGRLLTHPDSVRWESLGSGKLYASVEMLVPKDEIQQTRIRSARRTDWSSEVAAPIGKALLFVGGMLAIGLTFLVMAFLVLKNAIAGIDAGMIGGILLVLLILFAITRTNHSGACPGIAVHCKGCKR
jgi:hypothetical protein